ncbi:MAG: SAM-dependent methyltransferase, partial [Acidimicrobiia bacterium]|nr:SAM-dependent methyltransferase [Acidimicrobiia bacterium]
MAMTSRDAGDEIRAAVAGAGGALSFAEFMRLALYGERGFYTSAGGGHAGRRGDFLTAAEVGPLFGAVVGRYLDGEWDRLGRPDPFLVVDAGAGPGTLARAILAAAPRCAGALQYVAVEISAGQRARHPAAVESVAMMPSGPLDGVVLAVELLDNLPFRLAVFDGSWREALVSADGTAFAEVLSPPLRPVPPMLPSRPQHGTRVPLADEAAAWVGDVLGRLRSGAVVMVDYARSTAELAGVPWRSWLRTYRGHERGEHYLRAVGRQDITADVPLDQLPATDNVWTQADFLRRWQIDDFVDEGRRRWAAAAAQPDLAALAMRSRAREADA